MVTLIDTDRLASQIRDSVLDARQKKVLFARLDQGLQAVEDGSSINCEGFGRIRTFSRLALAGPGVPARLAEAATGGTPSVETPLRTQVFQVAGCSWRCWYCYVDGNNLSSSPRGAKPMSAAEIIDLWEASHNRPSTIDLSGGQPDLVPEFLIWLLDELDRRGISGVTLRSEDNLSNFLLWEILSDEQRHRLASYQKYIRIGCFKGLDSGGFSSTTRADPKLFSRQFEVCRRLIENSFDFYAYATLVGEATGGERDRVARFLDSLQAIQENLPLRVVPLQVLPVASSEARIDCGRLKQMVNQYHLMAAWNIEMVRRFPTLKTSGLSAR